MYSPIADCLIRAEGASFAYLLLSYFQTSDIFIAEPPSELF